jgi:hypothetical protein
MNAKLICSMVAVMVLAMVGVGTAQELGGGVVYTDAKSKQVVYAPLSATSQPVSLTGDLKINIVGPSAISESGQWLIWFDVGSHAFWVREMPHYKAYRAPTSGMSCPGGHRSMVIKDIPSAVPGIPKNLCIAKNELFAYGINAVPANYSVNGSNTLLQKLPRASTDMVITCPLDSPAINPNGCDDLTMWVIGYNRGAPGSHYFPAYSKDWKKLACISKTTTGWGPIDIYIDKIANGEGRWAEDIKKYEVVWCPDESRTIEAQFSSCRGLAWRADDKITVLTDNSVCEADGTVVAQNINATKIFWISQTSFIYRNRQDGALYAWENGKSQKILNSVPEEFSYCSYSPLASRAPSFFFDPAREVLSSGKDTTCQRLVRIGNIFCDPGGYDEHGVNGTEVGKIPGQNRFEFCLLPEKLKAHRGENKDCAGLACKDVLSEGEEMQISDIKDPTIYTYTRPALGFREGYSNTMDPCNGMDGSRGINADKSVSLTFPKGAILLLKVDNRYAAIKPGRVQRKFTSWDNLPDEKFMARAYSIDKGTIERGKRDRVDLPWVYDTTYEWKYWPEGWKPEQTQTVTAAKVGLLAPQKN